jgi:hypothetical protein
MVQEQKCCLEGSSQQDGCARVDLEDAEAGREWCQAEAEAVRDSPLAGDEDGRSGQARGAASNAASGLRAGVCEGGAELDLEASRVALGRRGAGYLEVDADPVVVLVLQDIDVQGAKNERGRELRLDDVGAQDGVDRVVPALDLDEKKSAR